MSLRYRYDHRSVKQRRRRLVAVVLVLVLAIGAGVGALIWDLKRSDGGPVSSQGNSVVQVINEGVQRYTVNEANFTFDLPGDWKETGRQNTKNEQSITWQATRKNEDNRWLTLYIDIIPTTRPINRLVPIAAQGNMLSVGDMSDNCPTFTGGGTLNALEAGKLQPAPAKWQKVDFICNLPRVIENEVGTGSSDGVNTVIVKGPTKGEHKYFFLYTDHNIQPSYSIFFDALRSFRAK